MNDEEKKTVKKRSFREEIRLFLRSYGIIRECQPKYLVFSLLEQIFDTASVYVTLYASALVINGLTAGEETRSLIARAVAAVTVVFALNMTGMLVGYIEWYYEETLFNNLGYWVCQKRMGKMYEYAEDSEKERLFSRARFTLAESAFPDHGVPQMARVLLSFLASLSVSPGSSHPQNLRISQMATRSGRCPQAISARCTSSAMRSADASAEQVKRRSAVRRTFWKRMPFALRKLMRNILFHTQFWKELNSVGAICSGAKTPPSSESARNAQSQGSFSPVWSSSVSTRKITTSASVS